MVTEENWYTRVKDEPLKLNVKVSKYDPDLFMYQYRRTLHGLLLTHADDYLWGGSHVFVENIIKPLHKIFEIGSANEEAFRYLGLDLKEGDSSIVISQSNYVDSIESLNLDGEKDKNDVLNEPEIHNPMLSWVSSGWLRKQGQISSLNDATD